MENGEERYEQVWASMAYSLIKEELIPEARESACISYGFPRSPNARGEYWEIDGEEKIAIFIAPPEWKKPITMLTVLTHETIHSAIGGQDNKSHGARYKRIAQRIGLEGNLFDTPNDELASKLQDILDMLPEYPDVLKLKAKPRQKGRLRLWECTCGVKARVGRSEFHATCDLCNTAFELKD